MDFGRTRWDLLRRDTGVRLRLVPSVPDPWRSNIHYLGVAGSGDLWLGPELRVREGPKILWMLAIGLLILVLLLILGLILLWQFFLARWLIARSDKKYKRAPRLSFMPPHNPTQGSNEWILKGVRIKTKPRLVTLADGNTWSIDKFRIKRLRCPGNKVAVEIRYRPIDENKDKKKDVVKVRLEATNDNGGEQARHHISGLSDSQAADFILFIGESDR